ncbi:MAG TPA: PrpF domain-containing protein, partial [Roseateles sp.]|nr:PrpF domain-containing protein [Roseateles sp.]
VGPGDDALSISSRYFTPRRCHASHAVTGAIGVASALALPGTVASTDRPLAAGLHSIAVLHPQGRIDVEVTLAGAGPAARIERAALLRTARKILQGDLQIPGYAFA